MAKIGYGGNNEKGDTVWTLYQDMPVSVRSNGTRVDGVVYRVYDEGGIVDFLPSVVSV